VNGLSVPLYGGFTLTGGSTVAGNVALGGDNTVYLAQSLDVPSGSSWTDSGYLYLLAQTANVTLTNEGLISVQGGEISGWGYAGYSLVNSGTIINTGESLDLASGESDTWNGSEYVYAWDQITNNGTIEQSGPGTTYIGGSGSLVTNLSANTLTGGTWIASGGGSIVFPETANAIVTNNATVVLSGANAQILTASGSDGAYQSLDTTLTNNNGTLQVLGGRDFASGSSSNAIVNNGTLLIGGGTFYAATLTNNPGSVIGGFGTFSTTSGGVTVGNGVLLSLGVPTPGSYIGDLNFSSTLTLGGGGSAVFSIMNAGPAVAGVDYDTATVAGALTVTATPASQFTLTLQSINPGTGAPGLANFNPYQSYQWTLFSAGSLSGFSTSDFNVSAADFGNSLQGGTLSLGYSGSDIVLNFTPVPEPSTWALMVGGALALAASEVLRRRMRLRRA
jgi:hypothetical protein